MSVNVATGEILIPGNEGGTQGGYYARVTSTTNLSIAAANPSNPRIDLVCATSADAAYTIPTGGVSGTWALQVVTGTPTTGATLANLNGAAALPLSSLLLGYVLVPTSATNIITADIANVAGGCARASGAWVPLTLATNITAAVNYYVPSARLCGDRVELKGGMLNGTGGSVGAGSIVATLPSTTMYPSKTANVIAGGNGTGPGIIVSPVGGTVGTIVFQATWNIATNGYLDGVSYSLS